MSIVLGRVACHCSILVLRAIPFAILKGQNGKYVCGCIYKKMCYFPFPPCLENSCVFFSGPLHYGNKLIITRLLPIKATTGSVKLIFTKLISSVIGAILSQTIGTLGWGTA